MNNTALRTMTLMGLCSSATVAQAMEMTAPPFTHVVAQSGNWNHADTWEDGVLPRDDAVIHVPAGLSLNLPRTPRRAPRVSSIHVDGRLLLPGTATRTRLQVQTLNVRPGGFLRVGKRRRPVPTDKSVEIVFWADQPIEPTMDDLAPSRGGLVVHDGTVEMYGATRQHYRTLADDALAGDSQIEVAENDGSWQVGDTIVIASTDFSAVGDLQNESRVITGISGTTLTFDDPLDYDHQNFDCGPYSDEAFTCETAVHVAHLSRSIVLRSSVDGIASAQQIHKRGHVMVMGRCEDAYFQGVLFEHLGRTDKSTTLDDAVLQNGSVVGGTNPRARYPLHFHACGLGTETDPSVLRDAAVVQNSVVHGSPGWGMVNHSSHVHFEDNVVYDFTGAGFVAEAGDELGAFINNISMGGRGNGEFPFRRTYTVDQARFRLADMGFHGDGFWFQGTLTDIRNNIAAGNKGVGFTFYPLGVEVLRPNADAVRSGVGIEDGFIPIASARGTARQWASGESVDDRLIVDLPIYEFSDNTAYGNYIGVKFRYLQNGNSVGFKKFGIRGDLPAAAAQEYHPYNVDWLTLWNNHIGIHSTYNSNARINDAFIATNLGMPGGGIERATVGVESWHPSNSGNRLSDSVIIGYEYGVLKSGRDDELVVEFVQFDGNGQDQRDINRASDGSAFRAIRRDEMPVP